MQRSRSLHVVRGATASSVATFIALLSHIGGGGALPGPLGIVVPWVLSFTVCTLLAGRKLSLWRLAISVGISQMLFHVLFVLGTVDTSGAASTGHQHHGTIALPTVEGSAATAIMADASMWMSHAIAALITVGILHRGEREVRRALALMRDIARILARRVRALVTLPVEVDAPRLHLGTLVLGTRSHQVLLAAVRRRGPPLLSI
ncbi:hypothetical protein [Microbacterium suaedae]|uniref:hypothetical protein n=1 Tax=Microbacterium suaedae TaxID=2067813 RepID=UPI000DA1FB8D|nr:hypothetical protein [Microbacterium suaedae]